jgi:lysine 2,3-aminomutase
MPGTVQITGLRKPLVWSDWRSQMEHRISTLQQLREWIDVTPEEELAIQQCKSRFRWTITPYYASLMDRSDPHCPVRRQAVPSPDEFLDLPNTDVDPVGDRIYRVSNRVIHKYPDRIVLLVTKACPVYCRHCTRKYHTTDLDGTYFASGESTSWDQDFDYIAAHHEIRDVLLTGGDPLVYSDLRLSHILKRLRDIPHIEILRIGTRFPVLLPQRITDAFCLMLESYHPVWVNTHFNHPKEITIEAAEACDRLLHHGIVVQNQTVLLKGINDDFETMRSLLRKLLAIRVRPYYLYHCDRAAGVAHFVTDIAEGRAMMRRLLGQITGFGLPQYVITTRSGKLPLNEDYVRSVEDGNLCIENYQGTPILIPG